MQNNYDPKNFIKMGLYYHTLPTCNMHLYSIDCGGNYFSIMIDGVLLAGQFNELPIELFSLNCSRNHVEIGIEKGIKVVVVCKYDMNKDDIIIDDNGKFINNKMIMTFD